MKKVVILGTGYADYKPEHAVFSEIEYEIVELHVGMKREEVLKHLMDTNAILVRQTVIDREMFDAMECCEVIVRYGVGLDNIDLVRAKQKGIKVANIPDYGADIAVAEHAVALMFGCARRLAKRDGDVKAGKWDIGQAEPLMTFVGKTLGVVGYGAIARSFIHKVSCLGFTKVMVVDPALTEERAKQDGITKATVEDLARESDYISIHVPLLESTRNMFNKDVFAIMKPNAIIVNTGRGGIINEDDLYDALVNKTIFSAGLDTFEHEPVQQDNKLLTLDSVICSDHTAWYTVETVSTLQSKAAQEALRVFQGEPLLNWVNP